MKRYLLLAGLVISLFYSCGKSTTPTPDNGNNNGNGTTTTPTLAITDFSPKSGKPGTTITITGTGFGNDASLVNVLIIGNTSYATLVSVSPTTIVIKTDEATTSGKISVNVKGVNNGIGVASTADFTALPPDVRFLSFDGDNRLGHVIGLHGQGFGSDTNKVAISFGGTTAVKPTTISVGGNTMQTIIPRYAQEGKVTITVNGMSVISDQDLHFLVSLRDFTPKSASAGDTIKMTGVGFTNINDLSIDFNTGAYGAYRPIKVTPTEILVIVPSNAKSGYLTVNALSIIGTGDYISGDANKFTFVPIVSFNNSITPSSGKINDVIKINGDFVGADIKTIGVSFNGSKPVQPESIAGAIISVKVPSDAKTGKITISRTGYKSLTGSFTFTVLP